VQLSITGGQLYCSTAEALAATTTMIKATTIAIPLPNSTISLRRSGLISSSRLINSSLRMAAPLKNMLRSTSVH
jgi:hypothetical protein